MEIFEARTDIGLVREENEDAVLAIRHPRNKNIKLLIAADGMGGRKHGEVAANYVADSLSRWFCSERYIGSDHIQFFILQFSFFIPIEKGTGFLRFLFSIKSCRNP